MCVHPPSSWSHQGIHHKEYPFGPCDAPFHTTPRDVASNLSDNFPIQLLMDYCPANIPRWASVYRETVFARISFTVVVVQSNAVMSWALFFFFQAPTWNYNHRNQTRFWRIFGSTQPLLRQPRAHSQAKTTNQNKRLLTRKIVPHSSSMLRRNW